MSGFVSHKNHGRSSHVDSGYRKTWRAAWPVFEEFQRLLVVGHRSGTAGSVRAGLPSGAGRKQAEAIALDQKMAPRNAATFPRIDCLEQRGNARPLPQIVAGDYGKPNSMGCVEETGTTSIPVRGWHRWHPLQIRTHCKFQTFGCWPCSTNIPHRHGSCGRRWRPWQGCRNFVATRHRNYTTPRGKQLTALMVKSPNP